METIAKIRRLYHKEKLSIRAIALRANKTLTFEVSGAL